MVRIDGDDPTMLSTAVLARRRAVLEQTPASAAAFRLDALVAMAIPRAVVHAARGVANGGAGVLAVLHDLTLAAALADRIALMREGRIVAQGRPGAVLTPERLADVYGLPMCVMRPSDGG